MSGHEEMYVDGQRVETIERFQQPSDVELVAPSGINEVAFWDRVLTPEEIAEVYNGGQPTDLTGEGRLSDGLTAWYRLDDANPPDVTDAPGDDVPDTLPPPAGTAPD